MPHVDPWPTILFIQVSPSIADINPALAAFYTVDCNGQLLRVVCITDSQFLLVKTNFEGWVFAYLQQLIYFNDILLHSQSYARLYARQ
jgi:hypothetical protein